MMALIRQVRIALRDQAYGPLSSSQVCGLPLIRTFSELWKMRAKMETTHDNMKAITIGQSAGLLYSCITAAVWHVVHDFTSEAGVGLDPIFAAELSSMPVIVTAPTGTGFRLIEQKTSARTIVSFMTNLQCSTWERMWVQRASSLYPSCGRRSTIPRGCRQACPWRGLSWCQ